MTGAGGFVGRALVGALRQRGHRVSVAVRSPEAVPQGTEPRCIGDIATVANWAPALVGLDTIVHLAARVHLAGPQGEAAYMAANVAPTLRLAEAAAVAGVRRFVFLSSVKAMGEASPGRPLTEADPAMPADAYGRSKRAAEQGLAAIARRSGMDFVSLRPPLVHGPGVRANMLSLLRWIERGRPLPVSTAGNRRSLISVGNLASAIVSVVEHRESAGGVYMVTDGPALSTADLARGLAAGLGRQARLLPMPPMVLTLGSRLPVVGPALARLTGDLEIDGGLFRRTFDWNPVEDQAAALRATASWYAATSGIPVSDRSRAESPP